jgi:hypothetical protein
MSHMNKHTERLQLAIGHMWGAVEDLPLSARETAVLAWINSYEPETIEAVASIVDKARTAGAGTSA